MASVRHVLPDGALTSLHVAAFPRDRVRVRVARLEEPRTLVRWCRETSVAHAIVGGFFVRPHNAPLGELRIGGRPVEHVPFLAPWGAQRACLHVADDGAMAIARRPDLPAAPGGDLLQAGPLLVRDGASAITDGDDEGFTAGAAQFDSDISDGRHPRCALALTEDRVLAVCCDGRHADEAGMTLGELADALVGMGAHSALNLDGGGSASLVCHGELVNRPREQHGIELLDGRPISTALVFESAA
ncbi:MAG: phosphodiester glycosidase family protein [Solirubrobacteraceae bacterium]|nr:phosphodiester glycosidase family protein [Solirubrobacteraceae bacterium]